MDTRWMDARNILLIRLDNLGDVLLCTPAFHAVRQTLPDAKLTLLASPVGAQAGRMNPDLDEVIVYDAPWTDPWGKLPHDSAREQEMIRLIKQRQFDAAIIFTSFRQSSLPAAYVCYLADIPLRLAASIDGSGSLLTTRHKHPDQPMHEVERALDLVGAAGFSTSDLDLVLQVPDEVVESVRRRLALSDRLPRPWVVVHPGCSMPARTYPWDMFAEVGDGLVTELGASVMFTGVESERALVDMIRARMNAGSLSLAGELTFPEFAAAISLADVVVTNNTGPAHMAAALHTPVVDLFALTNPPEQWRPWRVPHRLLNVDVPCRICYSRVCPYNQECLRGVPPTAVVEATAELIRETAGVSL